LQRPLDGNGPAATSSRRPYRGLGLLRRPTTRWLLPVRSNARVWNINGPKTGHTWSRRIKGCQRVSRGLGTTRPNQHPSDLKKFKNVISQHAVRTERVVHVLPDWVGVAADFDGVHLSWQGSSPPRIYQRPFQCRHHDDALLGKRTHTWLHDVFDEPKPLDAPTLTGRVGGALALTLLATLSVRYQTDWSSKDSWVVKASSVKVRRIQLLT